MVAPDRLRFDFTHFKALSNDELEKIEDLVNRCIKADDKVAEKIEDLHQAKKQGAIALFGEKYDKSVRMISVKDYSKELCGGTHLSSTSKIGSFRIISENSISAGIRRIEAVTGSYADEKTKQEQKLLKEICNALNTKPEKVIQQIQALTERLKKLDKDLKDIKAKLSTSDLDAVIKKAKTINDIKVISHLAEGSDMQSLRSMTDEIKNKVGSCVVCLGSKSERGALLTLGVTKDLTGKGLDAVKLIEKIAKLIGGKGGGRAEFAQAGGKDVTKLQEAIEKVGEFLK